MQSVKNNFNTGLPAQNVIITDLDKSDLDIMATSHRKVPKKRDNKTLCTMTGNFSRSRSAECNVRPVQVATTDKVKSKSSKNHTYLHDLLQSKQNEMEKMFQRIVTLQEYNEQFAAENNKLYKQIQTLEQRIDQMQIRIDNCEDCKHATQQIAELTNHNKELLADLDMMKNLVYRLNVQIEAYQDQQRLQQNEQKRQTVGDTVKPPAEVDAQKLSAPLNRHTLAPLLQAYDEMIRDKDELFQQYKQEFEHFTGELKRVLEDNNKLLKQHEQLKKEVSSWREERIRLQAALSVCRKKAEAHALKSDLTKEKIVEVVQVYESRIQALGLEVEQLQSAYTRNKSELMQLKTFQAQPKDFVVTSLQQCKELLEGMKQEHSLEKNKLEQKISDLNERLVSTEEKLKTFKVENGNLKQEKQEVSAKLLEIQQEYAHVKTALEQMTQSRGRLKARLRMALQWAQKLEKGQTEIQGTWDALKRLETIVKHKEAQVRGLQARHLEEIDRMQKKLQVKEDTIRQILQSKATTHAVPLREEPEKTTA